MATVILENHGASSSYDKVIGPGDDDTLVRAKSLCFPLVRAKLHGSS